MGALDPLVERLTQDLRTVRDAIDSRPTLRLGTVTSVDPIRIHLDGDRNPLPAAPRSLVPVGPGDRVTVAHQKRSVTILGSTAHAHGHATGTQAGSSWTGYFEMLRVGRASGILSGHFYRTSTSITLSANATLSGTGLNPNSVLPPWAAIVGTGMGSTALIFPVAISGGGLNETIHLSISDAGVISMRTQTAIEFTTAVRIWIPPTAVRIQG